MLAEPNCSVRRCKHLRGAYQSDGTELSEKPACMAFPRGIPDFIAYGDNLHLEPVKGDHGIQYEVEDG